MTTRIPVVVAAAVVGLMGGVPAQAQPDARGSAVWQAPTRESVVAMAGSISSFVRDSKGAPVSGAIVSAVGGRTITGTTDAHGRCTLVAVPPGAYLVRVHRAGFTVAHSLIIRVAPGRVSPHSVVLVPLGVGDAGSVTSGEPEIMAAGFLPAGHAKDGQDDGDSQGGDQSETAWRLRHLRRSILKDAIAQVHIAEDGDYGDGVAAFFGRTMTAPVRAAASLFDDGPLSGQVNLLTTSSFDSADQWLSDFSLARGVAYLSLGAAAGQRGDWSVQAAVTQGDVASWMLAGSFISRPASTHRYQAGMTYAAQRYTGTNPASLAAVAEGTRNAGAIFAFDTWTLGRRASLVYGARYSSYGYMENALFSPRIQANLQPFDGIRLTVSASRRAEAPGADEFVPTTASNAWVPPERTFAPLVGTTFRPERTDTYQVALERDLSPTSVVGIRTFVQNTEDQVATLFGLGVLSTAPVSLDHYFVADAGDFVARGWAVSVTHVVAGRLRGTIDYSVTTAHWRTSDQYDALAAFAPSAARLEGERLHDLTTTLETDIPVTATRVFALYRINNAFAAATPDREEPTLAERFDVQVTQALPFMNFTNAQWEALVGIRNLFREVANDGSIYDELLVVHSPKRVVGGVTVRF
jgi:hypothetical protein